MPQILDAEPLGPLGYPPFSLKDLALRKDMLVAMNHRGVTISLSDGFVVAPGADLSTFSGEAERAAQRKHPDDGRTLQPRTDDCAGEATYERMVPGEGERPLHGILSALPPDIVIELENRDDHWRWPALAPLIVSAPVSTRHVVCCPRFGARVARGPTPGYGHDPGPNRLRLGDNPVRRFREDSR